jgi:NAD(P)-dependent dehydrogenase (short-subunit alcohol dehydrogenase family)
MSTAVRIGGALGAGLATRRLVRTMRAIELEGRTAIVTGGSRGLGFALARELLDRGARVAICARGEEQLERARQRLAEHGEVVAVPCDVADPDRVAELVAVTTERLGSVDVLINNAGVIAVGPVETQTIDDFEEMMAIHLGGLLNCTFAVLPQMLARHEGRIANITSIGGKISVPWLLPYNTSKFAAVGFSQGLRAELAGSGVQVTTVIPGLMRTGSYLAAYFKGERAELEYSLFTPLSVTPASTIAATRAARRIVGALRRGDPELTLTLHAKLAARASGVAPGVVSDVLAVVARMLPENRGTERRRGSEIDSALDRSLLTALGRRAARDLNQ